MAMTLEERRERHRARKRRYYHERGGKERQREYYDKPEVLARRNELSAQYAKTDNGKRDRANYAARNADWSRDYRKRWMRMRRNRDMPRAKVAKLWTLARRAAPAYLPPDVRDDIVMDIVAAVMEGCFLPKDIPTHAKAIITANQKHNSKWGPVSLDAATFADSNRTLHDTVSEGMWQ